MKIKTVYEKIDEIAPFKYTDKFDNTGLLIGDMENEVSFVVLCLDVTNDIILETLKIGKSGGLIISHHPVIFNPLKSVKSDSIVYQLIKNNINYIAAHTNYDVALGGITDQMADLLNFENTGEPLEFVCEENAKKIGYGKVCKCEITEIGRAS
ncbi:MAG: Nif3-like dinuclear metal center hexameric protein, partial [Ruminococcus sp.]|nr:Nif3-like dinuclear metal center hexameric protein [Ruminococcus sp.]